MSAATAAATTAVNDKSKEGVSTRFAKDQLKAIIERIEHLEEEKKAISDDIRDVYAEAKGNGYDVKALRTAHIFQCLCCAFSNAAFWSAPASR